jgi:hypothetical protein
MKVIYTMALVMLMPFLCVAQRTVDRGRAESFVARVQILAFASTGKFVGAPEVFSFVEISSKQNLTSRFKDGIANDVPFGTYVLDAGFSAFTREERVVRVAKKEVPIIVGIELRGELPEFPSYFRGRIIGAIPQSRSFVRVVGIISGIAEDSLIARDGSFEFSDLPQGEYILMVVNETGLVASRRIAMPATRLEVDIARDRVLR